LTQAGEEVDAAIADAAETLSRVLGIPFRLAALFDLINVLSRLIVRVTGLLGPPAVAA
jgi:hypothetical protein